MSLAGKPIRSVACIGEAMIELSSAEWPEARLGVAGDTYNTAVYLRRSLGDADIPVSYVTALGEDRFSDRIVAEMQRHGLRTDAVERRAGMAPGLYAITIDAGGERSFSYWRSVSAARTLFREPCRITLDTLTRFDMLLLSGISLAVLPPETRDALHGFLMRYRQDGGLVVFDGNYRPALWPDRATAQAALARMWGCCDIALPSVDDEMALFGDADEAAVKARLSACGVADGALKRGADGPVPLSAEQVSQTYPHAARVVDSTAAGDSFNAGYLAARLTGATEAEALMRGHLLAAKVVGVRGAIIEEQGA